MTQRKSNEAQLINQRRVQGEREQPAREEAFSESKRRINAERQVGQVGQVLVVQELTGTVRVWSSGTKIRRSDARRKCTTKERGAGSNAIPAKTDIWRMYLYLCMPSGGFNV